MKNPIKTLSKHEKILWLGSLAAVTLSNLAVPDPDFLTIAAAAIGVTSLAFAAGGNALAQALMILFSLIYGVISYRFRYFGEMFTYLGMTLPMSCWSLWTWLRNPSGENSGEVKIRSLGPAQLALVALAGIPVTFLFYRLLLALETPNLIFSTVSVMTSFLAAALTMLRSSYYALGYAANDVVLIVLWVMASLRDPAYIPVAVNFGVFFFNDLYGFASWKKREALQAHA